MGRYVAQPLTVKCQRIEDIRRFLLTCKGVSDQDQFGKRDYWQPPDMFEQTKKGDCDDFAFWTWRQLLSLGYDARIVFGQTGRYGTGHAWVSFRRDGKWYLVEPMRRGVGPKMPQLSRLAYHPKLSVEWDGDKLSYFAHQDRDFHPPFVRLLALVTEWSYFWTRIWLKVIFRVLNPFGFWRNTRQQA